MAIMDLFFPPAPVTRPSAGKSTKPPVVAKPALRSNHHALASNQRPTTRNASPFRNVTCWGQSYTPTNCTHRTV